MRNNWKISSSKFRLCITYFFPVEKKNGDFLTHIPIRMKRLLGEEVEIYILYCGYLNEKKLKKYDIICHKYGTNENRVKIPIIRLIEFAHKIRHLALREKIDIFMNATDHYFFFFIAIIARIYGSKTIARVTGIIPEEVVSQMDLKSKLRKKLGKICENISLKLSDHVLALSHHLKDLLVKRGTNPEKITVLSQGVDLSIFKFYPIGKKRLSNANKKRILYVGRINKLKGIEYLIRAYEIIKTQLKDIECIFVGHGNISHLVTPGQTLSGIHLMGYVPQEELPSVYKEVDVVVLPSLTEGLPNVVLEAQASGVPIVASAVGEIPRLLGQNRGIIVQPRDSRALAEGIMRALTDYNYCREAVQKSRKYVEVEHSFSVLKRKYIRLFEKVTSM